MQQIRGYDRGAKWNFYPSVTQTPLLQPLLVVLVVLLAPLVRRSLHWYYCRRRYSRRRCQAAWLQRWSRHHYCYHR